MIKKRKPMHIELQRHIIRKIILKRGNTEGRKTVEGKADLDNVDPNGETSVIDEGTILDNLDPELHLDENISLLESEGFILPKPIDEKNDYKTKKALQEQEEIEEVEKQKRKEQIKEFYEIKKKRPKRVIVDGEIHFVED